MKKSITFSTLIILFFLVTLSSCTYYAAFERETEREIKTKQELEEATGGLAEGVLGYFIGNWQANHIGRMQRQNDQRVASLKDLQQYNVRLSSYNYRLKQQVDKYERDIRKAANDQGARMNLATALNEINHQKSAMEVTRIALRKLTNLRYVLAGERQRTALMSHLSQRRQYEDQLRQMDSELSKLAYSVGRLKKMSRGDSSTGSDSRSMPNFPWPPPHPSAYSIIPPQLLPSLNNKNYLKNVAVKLEAAFDQAGYSQKKYYQVPDGFALVSQLEQFDPDGTPRTPPNRWVADFRPPKIFSLSSYLKALFTSNPGRYRIIAFIVTSQPFEESKETVTREEAMGWLDDGMIVLPESIGKQPYTEKHYCTAFIYEFEQPGKDKKPFFKPLSNLTGKDHLEKSKLWAALKK